MYTVATYRLAEALEWRFLFAIPRVAGWLALAIWLAAFVGLVRREWSITASPRREVR
jgi:hypothetical protein